MADRAEPLAALQDRIDAARARELAAQYGMPMAEGSPVLPMDNEAILNAARTIGYPVLVKPAGGGGGIGGLASMFSSLLPAMSDENEKTDKKKVGTDPNTGLDMYSYRYKGDPKTYPKVVGPMAQEIEKKYPDQVVNVAGSKAVNLGFGPMKRAFGNG